MISGALEIIYGVDAGLVHPLLLPASQGPERFGYIVIAYEDSPDVFDILFVRGNHVEEYAGLHHDLRTLLSEKSVQANLAASTLRCRVYLFSVSRHGFDRFRRTFHSVPSVNVVIDRLSRKQLSSLLIGTGCKNGILEIDRPSHPFPLIDLSRFYSVEELLKEALRFKQGRMILYDLELNAQLSQRAGAVMGEQPIDDRDPSDPGKSGPAGDTERPRGEQGEQPGGGSALPDPPPEAEGDTDLVLAFRNALAEFLAAVAGLSGGRLDRKTSDVLNSHFPHPGVFNPGIVSSLNAHLVLEVIEGSVNRTPYYRRKKVRSIALRIVKDLYDTNNEIVRRHGLEEKVQTCYQRLGE